MKKKKNEKKKKTLIKNEIRIRVRDERKKIKIRSGGGKFSTRKIEASKKGERKNKITADNKRKNAFLKAAEGNNKSDYIKTVANIGSNSDGRRKKFKIYIIGVQQQERNNNYNNTVGGVAKKYNKIISKIKNKICDIKQQATTEKSEYYINNAGVGGERKILIVFKSVAKDVTIKLNYNKRILRNIKQIKKY